MIMDKILLKSTINVILPLPHVLCTSNTLLYILLQQFVLLMDLPYMRVEWRCITMVNGVECVMMDGIWMMQKLCVENWAMGHLLCTLDYMDKAVDRFGLIMWIVLVLKTLLQVAHIADGGIIIVFMKKMLVLGVPQVMLQLIIIETYTRK